MCLACRLVVNFDPLLLNQSNAVFVHLVILQQTNLVELRDILILCAALAPGVLIQSQSRKVSGRVPSEFGTVPRQRPWSSTSGRNYSRTIYILHYYNVAGDAGTQFPSCASSGLSAECPESLKPLT